MNPQDNFYQVVNGKNSNTLNKLLSKQSGIDVNKADKQGNLALNIAASNKNLEMVKVLVSHGADLNLTNNKGMTALMAASFKGAEEVAEFLIKEGANLDITNPWGDTALMISIERSPAIAEQLINAGANVTIANNSKDLPIKRANRNHLDALSSMIRAKVEESTSQGGLSTTLLPKQLSTWRADIADRELNEQNNNAFEKAGNQPLLEGTISLLASVGVAVVTVATGIANSVTTPTPMIDSGSTDNNLLKSTEDSNDNAVQNLGVIVGVGTVVAAVVGFGLLGTACYLHRSRSNKRYNNCVEDNLANSSEQKPLV